MPPQNSLAVIIGPNWFQQFPGDFAASNDFSPRIGYTVGAEYSAELSPHWHLKAGLRYNELNYKFLAGPLTWPSEYSTGQYVYDPTLPHYITTKESDHALQYLIGLRWISKPKTWRFYIDAESGLTDYIERENEQKDAWRLTIGAGFGVSWYAQSGKISIFAQPIARLVFQDFGSEFFTYHGYRALVSTVETGARYHF